MRRLRSLARRRRWLSLSWRTMSEESQWTACCAPKTMYPLIDDPGAVVWEAAHAEIKTELQSEWCLGDRTNHALCTGSICNWSIHLGQPLRRAIERDI